MKTNKKYNIFVEDNGIGLLERYLDRIFTLFQRLRASKLLAKVEKPVPV